MSATNGSNKKVVMRITKFNYLFEVSWDLCVIRILKKSCAIVLSLDLAAAVHDFNHAKVYSIPIATIGIIVL